MATRIYSFANTYLSVSRYHTPHCRSALDPQSYESNAKFNNRCERSKSSNPLRYLKRDAVYEILYVAVH